MRPLDVLTRAVNAPAFNAAVVAVDAISLKGYPAFSSAWWGTAVFIAYFGTILVRRVDQRHRVVDGLCEELAALPERVAASGFSMRRNGDLPSEIRVPVPDHARQGNRWLAVFGVRPLTTTRRLYRAAITCTQLLDLPRPRLEADARSPILVLRFPSA